MGDSWHDREKSVRLLIEQKHQEDRGKRTYFSTSMVGERKEGRKKMILGFLLKSSRIRMSEFVEPRIKVHLLVEGYAYVPKSWDFTENPK